MAPLGGARSPARAYPALQWLLSVLYIIYSLRPASSHPTLTAFDIVGLVAECDGDHLTRHRATFVCITAATFSACSITTLFNAAIAGARFGPTPGNLLFAARVS